MRDDRKQLRWETIPRWNACQCSMCFTLLVFLSISQSIKVASLIKSPYLVILMQSAGSTIVYRAQFHDCVFVLSTI